MRQDGPLLDLASKHAGGRVLAGTSGDPEHPDDSAIDGDNRSFWLSTGLYPQELILELGRPGCVRSVRVVSTHVRRLRVEAACDAAQAWQLFEPLAEQEFEDTCGRLQLRELPCQGSEGAKRYVRILVVSGWLDFCSLHQVEVLGVGATAGGGDAAGPPGGAAPGDGAPCEAPEAPEPCEQERAHWLRLVGCDGWRLAEAPAALRADREVVLAAVRQHGMALEFASQRLRADHEVVLAALNQDPWAGQYMAEVLALEDGEPDPAAEPHA